MRYWMFNYWIWDLSIYWVTYLISGKQMFSPNIYEIMEIFKYFHNNVVQFAHGFI